MFGHKCTKVFKNYFINEQSHKIFHTDLFLCLLNVLKYVFASVELIALDCFCLCTLIVSLDDSVSVLIIHGWGLISESKLIPLERFFPDHE